MLDYKLLHCDRFGHNRGDSCIIFNIKIYSVVSSNTYNSNDHSIVQAKFSFRCFVISSFNVICCYLPLAEGLLEADRDRMSSFESALLHKLSKSVLNILLCDFNQQINLQNPKISGNNADHTFSKFLLNGLNLYVNEVTHATSIIDCIFCYNNEILYDVHCTENFSTGYHIYISFDIRQLKQPPAQRKSILHYNFKSAD